MAVWRRQAATDGPAAFNCREKKLFLSVRGFFLSIICAPKVDRNDKKMT